MEFKLSVMEYKDLVRTAVLPYYEKNDIAHQIDHADDVCNAALIIAEKIDCDIKPKMIIAAAYAHDLFSRNDKETRKNHHQEAFDFIMTSDADWLTVFSDDELFKIANACREHRASWKGTYSGPLSVIIATADRGMPNLDKYLHRAYLYGVNVLNYGHQEAIVRSLYHINWKFGVTGKAKVPPLWETYFEIELAQMRLMLETLSHGMSEQHGIRCIPTNGEQDHFEMDIKIVMLTSPDGLDLTSLFLKYYIASNQGSAFSNILIQKWLPSDHVVEV